MVSWYQLLVNTPIVSVFLCRTLCSFGDFEAELPWLDIAVLQKSAGKRDFDWRLMKRHAVIHIPES